MRFKSLDERAREQIAAWKQRNGRPTAIDLAALASVQQPERGRLLVTMGSIRMFIEIAENVQQSDPELAANMLQVATARAEDVMILFETAYGPGTWFTPVDIVGKAQAAPTTPDVPTKKRKRATRAELRRLAAEDQAAAHAAAQPPPRADDWCTHVPAGQGIVPIHYVINGVGHVKAYVLLYGFKNE